MDLSHYHVVLVFNNSTPHSFKNLQRLLSNRQFPRIIPYRWLYLLVWCCPSKQNIEDLERQMKDAAARLDFEEAARLRDIIRGMQD